jgi:hypothetical protein
VQVRLNGADVTSSFKPDPASGGWLGVVSGMADGSNTLTVSSPSDATRQGSGDARESSDHRARVLGSAADALRLRARELRPRPRARRELLGDDEGGLLLPLQRKQHVQALDTTAPRPADVATTTTTEGVVVPYIVRREMGTINRSVYLIAFLHEPGKPLPDPWTRTDGWNGRLVYSFGGGVRAGYHQGRSVGGLSANTNQLEHALYGDYVLARGFAIAAGSQNVYGTNASDLISAETMLMVKEHFIEKFGAPATRSASASRAARCSSTRSPTTIRAASTGSSRAQLS